MAVRAATCAFWEELFDVLGDILSVGDWLTWGSGRPPKGTGWWILLAVVLVALLVVLWAAHRVHHHG